MANKKAKEVNQFSKLLNAGKTSRNRLQEALVAETAFPSTVNYISKKNIGELPKKRLAREFCLKIFPFTFNNNFGRFSFQGF